MHRDNYIILPHPTAPQMLLTQTSDGWTLPLITVSEKMLALVEPLLDAVRHQFGMDVTVLRRVGVYHTTDAAGEAQSAGIYELENHSTTTALPAATRWIGEADLPSLTMPDGTHRDTIAAWFVEEADAVSPSLRVAWAYKGWFSRASAWIHTRLSEQGYTVTGPIAQLKHWSISSVLRIPTDKGFAFFKALPPYFAIEPVLTAALVRWYPDAIPHVLAIESSERWMLQRGFSGESLNIASPEAWHDAVRTFAHIQTECVARAPELLALGCIDRRIDVLRTQMGPFLAEPDLPALAGIGEDEITRLRALVPRLENLCDVVAAYGIPATLAHGDFHSNNIVVSGDHCIIYDWTDGSVSHPFFDMHTLFLSSFPDALQPERDQLRDTYLSAWASIAPHDQLVNAFEHAKLLNAFHQVISYRNIMSAMEPDARDELRGGLTYWLRMLLELE